MVLWPIGVLPVRALRSRNYRLFFAGQTVSLIGTWMTPLGILPELALGVQQESALQTPPED